MGVTAGELLLVLKAQDLASAVSKSMTAKMRRDMADLAAEAKASADKQSAAAREAAAAAEAHARQVERAQNLIKGALVAGGVAVAAAMVASGKAAMDFEQSLANVGSVTGATAREMAAMRAEALKIGQDTSKGAGEAVTAMGELVKAGMSVETVVGGAARSVVQMAEATGVDMSQAANMVSNALNTFSDEGLTAAQAAEMLAKAANASAVDVTDMGQALSSGGSVAAQANISMTDFAAAIGLMGNNAIKGSDAGTSLKAMIAGLTPNSKEAAGAMRELGFSAFDAAGNWKSFPQIIGDLQRAFSGLTPQQRAMNAELLFGSDGIRAFNVLMKEGVTGLDKFKASMQQAPSLAEQSAARMNTLSGQVEILKGTLETAAITAGSKALPALTSLAKVANEVLPPAFNAAGASFEFLEKHADILIPLGFAMAGMLTGALVPAMMREAAAASAAAAAYVAKAAAMAAANLPLVAAGAAIGLVAFGLWHMSQAANRAEQEARNLAQTMAQVASQSNPLIQKWVGLAGTGASLHDQLYSLNQTLYEMKYAAGDAAREVDRLTAQSNAGMATLDAMAAAGKANTEAYDQMSQTVGKVNDDLARAQQVYQLATANIEGLKIKAKELGFEFQVANNGVGEFVFGAGQMAQATKEEQDQLARVNQELKATEQAQKDARLAAIPFARQIDEIIEKGKDVEGAFAGARKAIRDLAGEMTASERANDNQVRKLEGIKLAAEAAYSAQTIDAARQYAQKALDAANASGVEGDALKIVEQNMAAVTRGAKLTEDQKKKLRDAIDALIKPLDDQNASMANDRQQADDMAQSQLGLGKSMDQLKLSIDTLVTTFTMRMGDIPKSAQDTRNAVLEKFTLSQLMYALGNAAIDGFTAGMIIKKAQAEEAARIVALGAKVAVAQALGVESPSKVFKAIGVFVVEGFILGMASKVHAVSGMAKELHDAGVEPVKESMVTLTEYVDKGVTSTASHISTLAAVMAGSVAAADEYRAALYGQREVVDDLNQQILVLQRQLLNTKPGSEARKAIQDQINGLRQQRSEIEQVISSTEEMVRGITRGVTALDGFSDALQRASRDTAALDQYGQAGAAAIDALATALLEDSPKAGAAAVKAMQAAAEAAHAAGVVNWKDLAAAQVAAYGAALSERTPEAIQAAIDSTQAIYDAIKAKAEAERPTLFSAIADALGARAIAEQVGSSWASMFVQVGAAIDAGKEIPVQAVGRFAADVLDTLQTLPDNLRGRLGTDFYQAMQEFMTNPSREALDQLRNLAGDIYNTARLIPDNLRRLSPEVRTVILDIVAQYRAGAIDIQAAIDQIQDAQNLIPKNLRNLTPAVQAEIMSIVDLWRTGAIDIEEATRRIEDATKRAEEAARRAAEAAGRAAAAGQAAAQQLSHTSGGSGVGSQRGSYTEDSNYGGIPGLTRASGVDENGNPFETFGYNKEIMDYYGDNLDAIEYDRRRGLGFFAPRSRNAEGGIFTKPTMMYDAQGRGHLFGEAGPEPFGPPSKLASMFGGAGIPSAGAKITINVTTNGPVFADKRQFEQAVIDGVNDGLRRGALASLVKQGSRS